jgi:hypothetical protein
MLFGGCVVWAATPHTQEQIYQKLFSATLSVLSYVCHQQLMLFVTSLFGPCFRYLLVCTVPLRPGLQSCLIDKQTAVVRFRRLKSNEVGGQREIERKGLTTNKVNK